jgi:hypothetical protein
MDMEYSVEVYRQLEKEFQNTALHRPMVFKRYEAGTVLTYDIKGVVQRNPARVTLIVDKFVGGGFAGQVYRVKILDMESEDGAIEGLKAAVSQCVVLDRFPGTVSTSSQPFRCQGRCAVAKIHPARFKTQIR